MRRSRRFTGLLSLSLLPIILVAGCRLAANRQNSIGRQQYESGQIAQAINRFQRALNLNPNNADAYYNLASSYYLLGKQNSNQQWVTQAEQLYRQAISLDGGHSDAHRGLAALLIETDRQRFAFDLVDDWRKRQPQSAEPLIEIARLYQEYGDHRRATDFLSDALRVDSDNVVALTALGHVREVQGQFNLAIENYTRSLQLNMNQPSIAQRVQELSLRLAQQQSQNQIR